MEQCFSINGVSLGQSLESLDDSAVKHRYDEIAPGLLQWDWARGGVETPNRVQFVHGKVARVNGWELELGERSFGGDVSKDQLREWISGLTLLENPLVEAQNSLVLETQTFTLQVMVRPGANAYHLTDHELWEQWRKIYRDFKDL